MSSLQLQSQQIDLYGKYFRRQEDERPRKNWWVGIAVPELDERQPQGWLAYLLFNVPLQSVDQCTFVLMWRTPYACHSISAPINSNTCTVKDPRTGHLFNLMPLSEINNKIPSEKNKEFIINVCKPTLYGHNEMCPPNSSICLVNETETDPKKR